MACPLETGGNATGRMHENLVMKHMATLQPNRRPGRSTDAAGVASSDFAQLPSVLTSREAANVLRVGVREVRTLVDTGQLPGMRLGPRKVIRISRAALLALLRVQLAG
jgi:excisionase family DNA binding protein